MSSAEHLRVARLLHDHGPLAPPELRARVEEEIARANDRPRGVRRPSLGVLAPAGALAAVLVAFALVLPLIFSDDPSALDAHALSARGPSGPAPAAQEARPELLSADLDGVAFPDWEPKFGWRAIGQRRDEIDGRETATVFYEHEGHTIAYTIVSGEPLDPPPGAEEQLRGGVDLQLSRDGHGHDIVTFERQGMTCVLSGHVKRQSTLLELASWDGDGEVSF
jgi:hypothetical protein